MNRVGSSIVVAGLLVCAFSLAGGWFGKQETSPVAPAPDISALLNPTDVQAQRQGQPAEIKTFVGRIAKSGHKFVLEDSSMRSFYQLDDQKKAAQYQGKNVRVTGTLDAENNVIRVEAIEEVV